MPSRLFSLRFSLFRRQRVFLLAAISVCFSGAVVAASASTAPAEAAAPGCTVSAILVNSCRPWLGAESGGYGVNTFKARMLEHESRIGRQLDIVHEYLGPGAVLTPDIVSLANRPGTIPLVNWAPSTRWVAAAGGNATVNSQIDAMAASVKSLGDTKIMMAVFHEPENDISPGGDANCPTTAFKGSAGAAADYVRMWHNVRQRFNQHGVTNVVWVMNYMGWKGWNCVVRDLWPGNQYVDWVTWDPYPNAATWTSFVSGFYNFLTAHNDAAHDFLSKPWGLSEFGYVGSNQTAAYALYDEARRDLHNNVFPKLKAYVVWDQHTAVSHDDRVGYTAAGVKDPTEQAHYNTFASDPLLSDDPVPAG
jgi:Glycosyl hydrolase family 26